MSIAHIYIDEFGTPALDTHKQGVTPYFIYTGVILEESDINKARLIHKKIVDCYFNGTHIKSKNISNDDKGHAKRARIIADLSTFNHYVVSLVIDKNKIDSKGLEQKQVFIKFFNHIFSKNFIDKYEEFHVYLDKLGRKEFQVSLAEYMGNRGFSKNLFSNNTFELRDDITEEPLIQLADFYSGCVGRYYCSTSNSNQTDAIHNLIKHRLFIDWFPKEYINYLGAECIDSKDFNKEIFDLSIKTATRYISDINDELGIEIVRILLQEAYINPFRPISSGELKKKITSKGLKISDPITEIAKLRDKGVLIVSPIGKKGYKFPCNEHEIAEFFDRLSSNVIPQLRRCNTLHRVLVEQSFSKYNLLGQKSFTLLNDLIDTVNNCQHV